LTKRNIKRVADLHPSTASSSREIASIDKKDLPSVEVAVKKITQPVSIMIIHNLIIFFSVILMGPY
jgi:hypothetical protein